MDSTILAIVNIGVGFILAILTFILHGLKATVDKIEAKLDAKVDKEAFDEHKAEAVSFRAEKERKFLLIDAALDGKVGTMLCDKLMTRAHEDHVGCSTVNKGNHDEIFERLRKAESIRGL